MLTILHYDHFNNAKCRKLFLYFFFFLHFFLQIFTSCVVSYPTVKKHHFRHTLFEIFMKIIYPFFTFLPIQIHVLSGLCNSIRSENNTLLLSFPDAHANPRNMGPPRDTENHYETRLWCAVDFNNLKCISFIKCRWILDDL